MNATFIQYASYDEIKGLIELGGLTEEQKDAALKRLIELLDKVFE